MRLVTRLAFLLVTSGLLSSAPSNDEVIIRLFSVRPSTTLLVQLAPDARISVQPGTAWEAGSRHEVRLCGTSLCLDGKNTPLSAVTLAIPPASRGATLLMNGAQRVVRGSIRVNPAAGALTVVWAAPLEEVTAAVVATESNGMNQLEAKKAMAVAVRSFYRAPRRHYGGWQFCDSTHCQTLNGVVNPASLNARATQATRGIVVTYHGHTVPVMYSSRCGGQTMTAADAGMHLRGYGFEAVVCEPCLREPSDWEFHAPLSMKEQISRLLDPPTGSPERLRIAMGQRLGWVFIRSNRFDCVTTDDEIVFEGHGLGHSIGLCQWGTARMADEGATFIEILRHYLPSASLTPAR